MLRIHPGCNPYYSSFYLQGLRDIFGSRHVQRTTKDFPTSFTNQLRFITPDGLKVVIDNYDSAKFKDKEGLVWCDCYAKINLDSSITPEEYSHKTLAIGPSFGIRIWSERLAWLRHALITHWRSQLPLSQLNKHYSYYRQLARLRLPITAYVPEKSEKNTIFFVSRLRQSTKATNELRAHFIHAAQSLPNITFEGGFVAKRNEFVPPEVADITLPSLINLSEYLRKLKRSVVAFNTPVVHECHGWKLGEFLALGKAIISTPLSYALPAPLEHGAHLHIVDGSLDSICAAILKINEDDAYRQQLEQNARAYFDTYLAPRVVIERMLAAARA